MTPGRAGRKLRRGDAYGGRWSVEPWKMQLNLPTNESGP